MPHTLISPTFSWDCPFNIVVCDALQLEEHLRWLEPSDGGVAPELDSIILMIFQAIYTVYNRQIYYCKH
jgi:hypothetical protein